jgi:thiol-disulfide isomerase/thioredoxin
MVSRRAAVLLLLATVVASLKLEPAQDVTDAELTAIVEGHPFAVAYFYAPWCGACKAQAPHFLDAATVLSKETPPVPMVKVDATKYQALAEQFSVQNYPTVLVFKGGDATEYAGPGDATGMVNTLRTQNVGSLKLRSSVDAERFLRVNLTDANAPTAARPVVVGIFTRY